MTRSNVCRDRFGGQKLKSSRRANVFRFAPELGHCPMQSALRICATIGHESDVTGFVEQNIFDA
jgi:hypothetical protein